jgi:hypothetical protein
MRDDDLKTATTFRHEFFRLSVATVIFIAIALLPRLF